MKFSWSFTRLNNFETCPKRHQEIDILKNYKEESEQLTWGNEVHKALELACSGKATLPPTMAVWQKFVDEVANGKGSVLVEQKYALRKDLTACEYFGPDAWYRGKADVVKIDGDIAIAIDWKTGKVKDDYTQLCVMALCVFAYHPEVQAIETRYVWLQHDAVTKNQYTRASIRSELPSILARIDAMQAAYDEGVFHPKPSPLCFKWCPVKTCMHHGKRVGR